MRKKEKRERAEARREEFMNEYRRVGLEAQRKDHEHKARQEAKKEREARAKNAELEGVVNV